MRRPKRERLHSIFSRFLRLNHQTWRWKSVKPPKGCARMPSIKFQIQNPVRWILFNERECKVRRTDFFIPTDRIMPTRTGSLKANSGARKEKTKDRVALAVVLIQVSTMDSRTGNLKRGQDQSWCTGFTGRASFPEQLVKFKACDLQDKAHIVHILPL